MRRLILLFSILLILAAGATAGAQDQRVFDRVDQAMEHLTAFLGRSVPVTRELNFWSWSEEIFPDPGLGCPAPGMFYPQVVTRAFRIGITVDEVSYDYRITGDGSLIVLCGGGFPLFRSDTALLPPDGQPVAPLPAAPWYAWAYLDGTDLLYAVNPAGVQAIVKRPELPGEALPRRVTLAISRGSSYLLQAVEMASGPQALSIYHFASGRFISLRAQPGEEINLGFAALGGQGLVGSPLIFDARETRALVGFADVDAGTWRVALIDLASGTTLAQLRDTDLPTRLGGAPIPAENPLADALEPDFMRFFPRPVYIDSAGRAHVQLIIAQAGGSSIYPAFAWDADASTAAPSPYIHTDIDIHPTTGEALFPALDPSVPALEPMGPFEAFNAIGRALPVGDALAAPQIVTSSPVWFHFAPLWADEGRKLIFRAWDNSDAQRWVLVDIATRGATFYDPSQASQASAAGVPGGMLAFRDFTAGGADLVLYGDFNRADVVWTAPPRSGQPLIVWASPLGTPFALTQIALNEWAQIDDFGAAFAPTTPVAPPPPAVAGTVFCPGAPPSQVFGGVIGRVTFTDGSPLNMRAEPTTGATILQVLAEGATFTVIGGPVCAANFTWWQISLPGGTIGWVAEGTVDTYFIEPAP